jgi:erythromycin esterase
MNTPNWYRQWLLPSLVAGVLLSCGEASVDGPNDTDDEGPTDQTEPSWLETHAIRLNSADPDATEPNLALIGEIIGDARIVGLGEATHGTAEFWQIRQKLSRYLVEEKGFTAILHEAPFPNSLYIDAYVTEGEGTALDAHQKLGYWRYQEMQELIEWMRTYNVQHGGPIPLLHYYGYDCAFRSWDASIDLITSYLEVVDPDVVDDVTTRLNNYTLDDARYVYTLLTNNADAYMAFSDSSKHALITKIAENLEPSWQIAYNLDNGLPDGDVRESFNIGNVNWIIDNLLDGGKVIIWAHNAHVGNIYLNDIAGAQAQMLGSRLKQQYGDDYYIIGTEFYAGTFLAWESCGGQVTDFIVHQAALPGEGTYAHHFHQAGIPLFFLDLSQVNYADPEANWLLGPLKVRFIGADYCAMSDAAYYYSTSLPVHYDGIFHFEDTNPVTRISF